MSNRSGTPYSAPTDADRRPVMLGVSTVDGITPTPLEVDPATGQLQTSGSGGGGGGTQYAELSTTSPATGNAILGRYLSSPSGGLTNGEMSMPLMDNFGQLKVVPVGTVSENLTQINGNTVATAANGLQEVALNDGTNTANVVAGDSGFNGVAVANGGIQYSFTTSTSGAQMIGPYNCEGYTWVEVVYTSVGSGLALTGQFSVTSGGNYNVSNSFGSGANQTSTSTLGTAVNTMYAGPIRGDFFRINVTALTSGTFTGTVTFRTIAPPIANVLATQSGNWSIGGAFATGSSVPTNGFYMAGNNGGNLTGIVMTGATVDSALPTAIESTAYGYSYNGSGWDRTRSATAASNTTGTGLLGVGLLEWDGTNYQRVPSARFAPSTTVLNTYSVHLTTNATTTPTASTAYISSIAISAEVGGTTSSVTIQDKQGTPLKLINGLATTAVSTTPTVVNFQTPVKMVSGIDIITAGAVAGTVDVWVNYYQ